jgi:hypothetical protein
LKLVLQLSGGQIEALKGSSISNIQVGRKCSANPTVEHSAG